MGPHNGKGRYSATMLIVALSLIGGLWTQAVLAASASADSLITTKPIKGSVLDAYERLKKIASQEGMQVIGELHQGKTLSMTGAKVQSETAFVGNPTTGKKLFEAEPGVGVVVPPRINIYADQQGQTRASYVKPSALLGTFDNPEIQQTAQMLDAKLDKILQALAE